MDEGITQTEWIRLLDESEKFQKTKNVDLMNNISGFVNESKIIQTQ